MKLFKITLKPQSSYSSNLQSDTFFGAFCWSYRYLYGEGQLKKFLETGNEGEPQIIFSNAFPEDYLPMPLGIRDSERTNFGASDKATAKLMYQEEKNLKKCSLVTKNAFRNIQNGNQKGFSKELSKEHVTQIETTHNLVMRDSGTVYHSEEGGNLFVKDEFFPDKDTLFDVYILSSLELSLLQDVLTLMFELGIGADKSKGKGNFTMVPSEKGDLLQDASKLMDVDDPNGFIAISNFIPDVHDPTQGWYKTFAKFGKLDREYAAGQYPFKKPLLFIQAGSMFKTDCFKQYYGKFINNVAVQSGVVVNACTIALPISTRQ